MLMAALGWRGVIYRCRNTYPGRHIVVLIAFEGILTEILKDLIALLNLICGSFVCHVVRTSQREAQTGLAIQGCLPSRRQFGAKPVVGEVGPDHDASLECRSGAAAGLRRPRPCLGVSWCEG